VIQTELNLSVNEDLQLAYNRLLKCFGIFAHVDVNTMREQFIHVTASGNGCVYRTEFASV